MMEKITIHKEVNHLLHDGYQFRKVWIMSDGTICWKCVKLNCRSRLRVNEKDNVVSFSVHNHNPAPEPCESKKTIAEMCHIDVEKPQHIFLKAAAAIPLSNGTECYVIWLFVKRLSQEAIQRRSQRDRLVKIKVFKLRRDADDIPCNIILRSAGGESFHSAGPTTAKVRFWDREVRDQGIRRSQRTVERSGREERADGGLHMSSHR